VRGCGFRKFDCASPGSDCAAPRNSLTPDLPPEIVIFNDDLPWLDEKVRGIFQYWYARGCTGGRRHRRRDSGDPWRCQRDLAKVRV
jgi:hypothetical protein